MQLSSILSRTREVCRRKHLSWATEEAYTGWIRRYATFLSALKEKGRDQGLSSEAKFERFLTRIAKSGCAASTQNQAFNAVLFLYRNVLEKPLERVQALRAKRPAHVRTAPSRQQVASLLEYVEDVHEYPTRLITQLLYGCGLRVSEPLNLRIKDVDLENSRLTIRDAKGGKSRVVPLPCSLVAPIQEQMQRARLLWEADQLKSVPVPLPGRLGIKYPKAAGSWAWYWLFPSHKPCKHPRSGEVVRWRVHESNVQRAVRWAARKCDLEGAVTPHVLRHAYATHVMQQGAYVRDVQVILGHNSLETTMQYLHTEAGRVQSPLESLSVPANQPQVAVRLNDAPASLVVTAPVPQSGFTSTGDRLDERAEVDALFTNAETRSVGRERSYSPSRAAEQSQHPGIGLYRGERLNDAANYNRGGRFLDSMSSQEGVRNLCAGRRREIESERTSIFSDASDIESKNRPLPPSSNVPGCKENSSGANQSSTGDNENTSAHDE